MSEKKKVGRKPGTKVNQRPHDQHEADLAETSRLSRMGFSPVEIVRQFDGRVSLAEVTRDLKTIRQRFLDSMIEDRRVMAMEARELIRDVRRMALQAWFKSQEDAERLVSKEKTTDNGTTSEQTHIKTGQTGNPEFLKIINDTIERECKLMGLDEAIKIDLTSDGQRINWFEMTEPSRFKDMEDELEKVIRMEREQGRIGFNNLINGQQEEDNADS